ncbi:unnamed protein product [Rangifer tarandus platyrhynchus]|uniref:L27 domain-containing protein n=1 Tax=Rangifer tarandus platyrhynchus TaxID=3082113 RepID=A0ABN9A4W4_RANTA|nr:unnamed protein product [Rangifer tarandus platyrhynchus]
MRKIENNKCWARESCACHGSTEPSGYLIVLSGGRGCSLGTSARPADTREGAPAVAMTTRSRNGLHGDTQTLVVSPGVAAGVGILAAFQGTQMQPHMNSQKDLTFLWDVFGEKSLHSLVKIHEKLHYYEKQNPMPILQGAAALADDLVEELQNKPINSEI